VCGFDPASAGWEWTTFHVYQLTEQQSVQRPGDELERLILVLEGYARVHAGERDLGAGLGALDRCGFGTRGLDWRRWLRIDPLRWRVRSRRRGFGFGRESLGAQDVALGIRDAPSGIVDQPPAVEYEDPGATLAATVPGRRPAGPLGGAGARVHPLVHARRDRYRDHHDRGEDEER